MRWSFPAVHTWPAAAVRGGPAMWPLPSGDTADIAGTCPEADLPRFRGATHAKEASSLLEVAQIGRRLAFPGRHQHAVGAEVIVLITDLHPNLPVLAIQIEPDR